MKKQEFEERFEEFTRRMLHFGKDQLKRYSPRGIYVSEALSVAEDCFKTSIERFRREQKGQWKRLNGNGKNGNGKSAVSKEIVEN